MNALPKTEKKIEILLIEDNPSDARLVSIALKGFDQPHELRVIQDGSSALEYLQKKRPHDDARRPDIVFLDWNLPGKNGGEILREIRKDPGLKDLPVVVLTGVNLDQLIHDAYEAGTNLFVTKPITLDRFSVILRYVLDTLGRGHFPHPPTELS